MPLIDSIVKQGHRRLVTPPRRFARRGAVSSASHRSHSVNDALGARNIAICNSYKLLQAYS